MIDVNILNTKNSLNLFDSDHLTKYFSVSTDKATNPVNMMGASKRIMELFLMEASNRFNISSARFANVAFSDGSLLHGFTKRILKTQPISAPRDVLRYFITPEESGQLCLISTILGDNKDIFFPKLSDHIKLTPFIVILERYLASLGYEIYECSSESEARSKISMLTKKNQWPCYFFNSDTTGEKEYEEFFKHSDIINYEKYTNIGIIKENSSFNKDYLDNFINNLNIIRNKKKINKREIISLFKEILPDFSHFEKGKSLDERM